MKTVGQRNFKLLGGQGKTEERQDELIPVYPPYNFVVRYYNFISVHFNFYLNDL
jgi:hypothetical protein